MKKIIVTKVDVPSEAMASYDFSPLDYTDAFRVQLFTDSHISMIELANNIFGEIDSYPVYVRALLHMRDFLVKPLGLKTIDSLEDITDKSNWISFFQIFQASENEIILGNDDAHLDVRVSLLRKMNDDNTFLIVSTFVRFNKLIGRLYFTIVRFFHKIIIPATIKKSIKNIIKQNS